MRRARATLQDVAREAEVSKSIASRVLNGTPTLSVRPETRSRVLHAADRLGYRPHFAARGLRRAQTGALGLLVPDLAMPVYARIVRGAFTRALERDVAVLLLEDQQPEDSVPTVSRLVQQGRIDGLIVASARPEHPLLAPLRDGLVSHVFVNRAVPGSDANVTMSDPEASAAAVDHLAALGHRQIGHVSGPLAVDPGRRRASGFADRARELGLDPSRVAESEFTEQGGLTAALELLRRHPELTAIYASSLSQAVGVLDAAWRVDLRVPDDLSVVTYDEMPLAEHLRPPLTTISMPLAELGAAAVDAVIEQLEGAPPHCIVIERPPQVVVRASTAPPRSSET
jgi:DNA-binding LacI/PurR family transcriptional regulator